MVVPQATSTVVKIDLSVGARYDKNIEIKTKKLNLNVYGTARSSFIYITVMLCNYKYIAIQITSNLFT